MKAKRARNQSGISLAFVGICAVLLIVLIFLGFQYSSSSVDPGKYATPSTRPS